MTLGYGPIIPAFATRDQVEAYVGPARAAQLPVIANPDSEMDRLIARASELIYQATGNLATRAVQGLLLADYFGGYIDPLTLPTPLQKSDYQFGLAQAVAAQIEFWLEFGEDHAIVALPAGSSASSGKVQVSQLPGQLCRRALFHLSSLGMLSSKVAIR